MLCRVGVSLGGVGRSGLGTGIAWVDVLGRGRTLYCQGRAGDSLLGLGGGYHCWGEDFWGCHCRGIACLSLLDRRLPGLSLSGLSGGLPLPSLVGWLSLLGRDKCLHGRDGIGAIITRARVFMPGWNRGCHCRGGTGTYVTGMRWGLSFPGHGGVVTGWVWLTLAECGWVGTFIAGEGRDGGYHCQSGVGLPLSGKRVGLH